MTDEEKLREALERTDKLRADVEELKKLDFDSLFSKKSRGSKDPDRQSGPVMIRAKNGFVETKDDGSTIVPLDVSYLESAAELPRTSTPMRSRHQSSALNKEWRYRNFKRCGQCGEYDTYASRGLPLKIWCYKCGAADDAVLKDYSPTEAFVPKGKPITCSECGKRIEIARGALLFPTGEKDPVDGRPDYECAVCYKKKKGI